MLVYGIPLGVLGLPLRPRKEKVEEDGDGDFLDSLGGLVGGGFSLRKAGMRRSGSRLIEIGGGAAESNDELRESGARSCCCKRNIAGLVSGLLHGKELNSGSLARSGGRGSRSVSKSSDGSLIDVAGELKEEKTSECREPREVGLVLLVGLREERRAAIEGGRFG